MQSPQFPINCKNKNCKNYHFLSIIAFFLSKLIILFIWVASIQYHISCRCATVTQHLYILRGDQHTKSSHHLFTMQSYLNIIDYIPLHFFHPCPNCLPPPATISLLSVLFRPLFAYNFFTIHLFIFCNLTSNLFHQPALIKAFFFIQILLESIITFDIYEHTLILGWHLKLIFHDKHSKSEQKRHPL